MYCRGGVRKGSSGEWSFPHREPDEAGILALHCSAAYVRFPCEDLGCWVLRHEVLVPHRRLSIFDKKFKFCETQRRDANLPLLHPQNHNAKMLRQM